MVQLPAYLVATIIMSSWWNLTSGKLKVRSKTPTKILETQATRKASLDSWLCIALPSLSRDRTIMKKSIN